MNTEWGREIEGQTEELESVSGEGVEVEVERADDGEQDSIEVEQSSVATAAVAAAETRGIDVSGRVTL